MGGLETKIPEGEFLGEVYSRREFLTSAAKSVRAISGFSFLADVLFRMGPAYGHVPSGLMLSPGESITAMTSGGEITITAGRGLLNRTYIWAADGKCTEEVVLQREISGDDKITGMASYGFTFPQSYPREECESLFAGKKVEGHVRMNDVKDFKKWYEERYKNEKRGEVKFGTAVYRSDGLLIGIRMIKPYGREILEVDLFQILVGGKKPTNLPGSQDGKITYEHKPLDKPHMRSHLRS